MGIIFDQSILKQSFQEMAKSISDNYIASSPIVKMSDHFLQSQQSVQDTPRAEQKDVIIVLYDDHAHPAKAQFHVVPLPTAHETQVQWGVLFTDRDGLEAHLTSFQTVRPQASWSRNISAHSLCSEARVEAQEKNRPTRTISHSSPLKGR